MITCTTLPDRRFDTNSNGSSSPSRKEPSTGNTLHNARIMNEIKIIQKVKDIISRYLLNLYLADNGLSVGDCY